MDTYAWISGGFFILHCVDVFMGNGDKKMQSILTVNKDGNSMIAKWELSENGKTWEPWMHIELNK